MLHLFSVGIFLRQEMWTFILKDKMGIDYVFQNKATIYNMDHPLSVQI